jgi:hypothetical protein
MACTFQQTGAVSIIIIEEWCLLGCYAVKTSNLTLLLLFDCKWAVNLVEAVIQYSTTNNTKNIKQKKPAMVLSPQANCTY